MSVVTNSPVVERKLALTRVLNAPRSLVFKAWTDPEQLGQWWGPTGFTNPVCELDLRVHGEIRIDMRAPDGTVYPMSGAFREIVEPERLVFTAAALDANGKPRFENLNTVTFEELDENRTLLTVHVRVLWETPEAAPALDGMSTGWSMTVDRLDAFVAPGSPKTDTSDRELRASRFFKAPRPLVYRMWTEPEHIAQWWGPRGFTTTIQQMDVREGGEWRFILHGPDGTDYPNHTVYEEIAPPERLVLKHLSWPHHRMHIRFTDAEGGTNVSIHMLFEEAADFNKVVLEYGAAKGLRENLDRLGEHISKL
jgi:uncharacterized protein YndB with AHSA1/START domain